MINQNKAYLKSIIIDGESFQIFSIPDLMDDLHTSIEHLPYTIRILLEGCLHNNGKQGFSLTHLSDLAGWQPISHAPRSPIPFLPARILMQDFTGVPVLNDLTALRNAVQQDGRDPEMINPHIQADLVIDHSVQVIASGCAQAQRINEEKEFQQNFERYHFLKWSQNSYENLNILPPGLGICHQVNLEYLAKVAYIKKSNEGNKLIYPDSVLGTDSHTTMINGLGVIGWGVGGIEALAALLNYPSEFSIPDVIGVHLHGKVNEDCTPTDVTLALTAKLREFGVVGKFVELFGESVSGLPVETRAMIANMSPESGATMTFFPVDDQTISYLRRTGRTSLHTKMVEYYFKQQGLFRKDSNKEITYSNSIDFDLKHVQPVLAGPKRPQDIFPVSSAKSAFQRSLIAKKGLHGFGLTAQDAEKKKAITVGGRDVQLKHGIVLIAAITSCTNTSNPGVLITAALMAQKAAALGLRCKPWVKTSFAPGSRVVPSYLEKAGLMEGLNTLGFQVVGFGCTTCIGNAGPIKSEIARAIRENNIIATAFLSGNRNFEGRIHPDIQANFLASPPMVLVYALAGTIDFDFEKEPLGTDLSGTPVYLKDIYPAQSEVAAVSEKNITDSLYSKNYEDIYHENDHWEKMETITDNIFPWDSKSEILKEPAFLFEGFPSETGAISDIRNAHALAVLGDSITTDHISPAGSIAPENPAGQYLREKNIPTDDFISFGARRGNHEVMERGTFSNARLQNLMVPEKDGGFTIHVPSGEMMTIFNASKRYRQTKTPLVILAGKAYGTGSSRDWAAKGTYLLGVQAVIASSFERIHRTNLVCMGILPLQFQPDENTTALRLNGFEKYSINGINEIHSIQPILEVTAYRDDQSAVVFQATARIDTPLELSYFLAGGLMRRLRMEP